jgi:uncharacterized protein
MFRCRGEETRNSQARLTTPGDQAAPSRQQSPAFGFGSLPWAWLFAVGIFFLFSSCTVLPPQPDRARFIMLTPATPAAFNHEKPSAGLGSIAIGLGPVELPAYLDREELVMRTSPNGFELSETNRWAESLPDSFCKVLAADLSERLDNAALVQYPWDPETRLDYTVRVEIQNFEADTNQTASLVAHWEVRAAQGDQTISTREAQISRSLTSLSGDAVAAALSDSVAELAGQIASTIVQAQQQRVARGSR